MMTAARGFLLEVPYHLKPLTRAAFLCETVISEPMECTVNAIREQFSVCTADEGILESSDRFTVLNSQGTTPDLPIGSCQGWDALGRGGAAVDQRPLTIDEDRHRETRRSGSYPKNRVCVCVRAGEGEGVRGRVGACVGVGCVCGCVVYRILRVRGEEAGFRAVG